MTTLRKAALSACLLEGLLCLVVFAGTQRDGDGFGATWYGKVALLLLWPGLKAEDYFSGGFATVFGVSLLFWFVIWLLVWKAIGRVQTTRQGTI